ncbi:alanine racemase [Paenibacillus aurantius]|uniref:Alanine racemase n=1 Tax=Paenibacillus aurantius TaxID=2918900 RepID=A0AA96LLH9_9BACL|nr:alanine racemase [Paenibacillus aurantius]WNQ14311.1 alanine racemase [Paenibacillus aurantius]
MDSFYRPTWVEVSLDALRHNLYAFRRKLPDEIEMMAVVKADAYGHGAIQVAKEALACGVSYLAVAFLDEALELRRAGIDAPILVLGYTPVQGVALALPHDITLNVYDEEVLEAVNAWGQEGRRRGKIHIKLDTGMGRVGLMDHHEAVAFIDRALDLPGVEVEGLFTHYASADEADKTYTREQYTRFKQVVDHFAAKGVAFRHLHAGNSAAAIDTPELTCSMVRLGVSMYGLYPSAEVDSSRIELRPVMSMKTGIVMLKSMPAGVGISYGSTYHTETDGELIATLPVGYADGYSRMLSRKAYALVRGKRVPVVGNICMDQCMIRVSEVPGVRMGDEVVLFGAQGDDSIPVEELADKLGTINYEITCMISHRVPRVYVSEGKIVNTVNLLQHYS